jgi:single-stranded DNA-binding protein
VAGGVNRVVLVGTIGRYGMEVKHSTGGTPSASFMLIVSEMGTDGKAHETYVPCEIWGKKAAAAGEVDAGQLVLFEGKLRKRQKGEGQWELCVSGWEVTPVLAPQASLTGSSN